MTLFMPLVAMFLSLSAPVDERPRDMPAPIVCDEQVICHQFQVADAVQAAAMPVPPRISSRNPP